MTTAASLSARFVEAVPSRAARGAIGITLFAVLTALGARIALPLPGTPVPFTFQVLFVLLAGALLGPGRGALSQLLYISAGAAGLPVFAAGGGFLYLLGPTGGYLLAYPLAAYLVGWLMASSLHRSVLALSMGLLAIYAGGISWLSAWASLDMAVALGLRPFVLADLAKAAVVLLIVRRYRDPALRFFTS